MSASFSPAMHAWARKHAARLADEFMRADACERDSPAAYFEAICREQKLMASLREHAEPVFMERCGELEGGGDHG